MGINIRIEYMEAIFQRIGIEATFEQITKATEMFLGAIDAEFDYTYVKQSEPKTNDCIQCRRLQADLFSIEAERNVYRDSVKARRKTDDVWIENGEVLYRK